MKRFSPANGVYWGFGVSALVLAGLFFGLYGLSRPETAGADTERLFLHCAAGIRPPVAEIIEDYEREYGVVVETSFAGSETLLNNIRVAKRGDLYLAADDSYTAAAKKDGLVAEEFPLGTQKPIIAVAKGNPKGIHSVDDLLRGGVRVAVGNPEQAAVGQLTRKLLQASGHWDRLKKSIEGSGGTFLPTVPEVANAVKVGSVDAGILWDTTVIPQADLEIVETPELDAGTAQVTLGVLTTSDHPTAALKFARYMSARDRGLKTFKKLGWTVPEGDEWAERPEITFFAGAVNQRAVQPIVTEFARREGVTVNTVYNGCGILSGTMDQILAGEQDSPFPDIFMACDVYYLTIVGQHFQEAVNVSDTDIVIAVPEGNPADIHTLRDLTKPGVKVVLGHPEQCTIGVLTHQLLEAEGLLSAVEPNVVAEKPSSAMLVPAVATGHADATLAYRTDTLAESDKIDAIPIDSARAKAIQPYTIAKQSRHKELARRLYRRIAASGDRFRELGFNFRLDEKAAP